MKPGEGAEYEGKDVPGVTGQSTTLDAITFSGKGGEKADIKLGGEAGEESSSRPPAKAEPAGGAAHREAKLSDKAVRVGDIYTTKDGHTYEVQKINPDGSVSYRFTNSKNGKSVESKMAGQTFDRTTAEMEKTAKAATPEPPVKAEAPRDHAATGAETPKAQPKEPWEMTRDEYVNDTSRLEPRDKIKVTLGGHTYTEEVGKVYKDGTVVVDIFGLKHLKPGEFEIIPNKDKRADRHKMLVERESKNPNRTLAENVLDDYPEPEAEVGGRSLHADGRAREKCAKGGGKRHNIRGRHNPPTFQICADVS